MIGTFLPPRRDETNYSMCAEYQDLLGARSARIVNEDLFGIRIKPLLAAFPRRLNYLEEHLPPDTGITAKQLIDDHTILPFIRPFLTEQNADQFMNGMKGDGIGFLGNKAFGGAKALRTLRYCPACAATDRENPRGAYWHRIHQVPGLFVCPHHETLLEEIHLAFTNKGMETSYISAETAIPAGCKARSIDVSDAWHALQLWLAEQVLWLLSNPCPVLNREHLVNFYRVQLAVSGHERIETNRIANFMRVFEQTIAPEWIQALGWSPLITYNRVCWLHEVLLRGSGHVLKHLLIMRCLGVTIKEVIPALGSELIFEPGPWPCLNPECRNSGKNVISAYTLSASDEGLPNGTFTCECGFAYRRRGPDRDGKRRFAVSRIVATGDAWDSQFAKMWSDPAKTIHAISRRLLVKDARVLTEAKRLGLPEEKFRRAPYSAKSKHTATNGYREKNRAAFVRCLKEHPDATRTDLYKICGGPVDWLRRRDPEWFLEHFPKPRKAAVVSVEPYVNWEMRDRQLASEIRAARAHLVELPGRPIRITATRLLKVAAVSRYSLKKNLDKARAALEDTVESDQSFALRQIKWFAQREPGATVRAILRRARVRNEWFDESSFCAAVKEILVWAGKEIHSADGATAHRSEDLADDTVRMNVQGAA